MPTLDWGRAHPARDAASASPAAYLQTSEAPVLGTLNFWKSGHLGWFWFCVILSESLALGFSGYLDTPFPWWVRLRWIAAPGANPRSTSL